MASLFDGFARARDGACCGRESAHSVARYLSESSSVIKWAQRQRRTGSLRPARWRASVASPIGEHRTWLLARVAGDLNVTCAVWQGSLTIGDHGLSRDGRALLHHEDQSFKKTVFR